MKIKVKRFNESDIPVLEDGELGFTTVTKKFFIGDTLINGGESAGDQTYTHIQSVPTTTWTIELPPDFKKFPSVTITDSAGTVVNGGTKYDEALNNVTLTFTTAFSGEAHFN